MKSIVCNECHMAIEPKDIQKIVIYDTFIFRRFEYYCPKHRKKYNKVIRDSDGIAYYKKSI